MNKTINTVPSNNSGADIELKYEKNFHNRLNDYDNESMYIPNVLTLSEESAIPMIADKDAVDHFPKNIQPCGRSHGCGQGAATHT